MYTSDVGPSKDHASAVGMSPVWLGVAIALFFPLGLFLLWRHPTLGRSPRWWAVGGAWGLLVVIGAINGEKDKAQRTSPPGIVGGRRVAAVGSTDSSAQRSAPDVKPSSGITGPAVGVEEGPARASDGVIGTTDAALIAEFDADEVAADRRYRGKTLRVVCEKWAAGPHPDAAYYAGLGEAIKVVEEPIPGKPFTRKRTVEADHSVVCLFDEAQARAFRELPRGGRRYAMIGEYAGVKGGRIDGFARGGEIRLRACRAEVAEPTASAETPERPGSVAESRGARQAKRQSFSLSKGFGRGSLKILLPEYEIGLEMSDLELDGTDRVYFTAVWKPPGIGSSPRRPYKIYDSKGVVLESGTLMFNSITSGEPTRGYLYLGSGNLKSAQRIEIQ